MVKTGKAMRQRKLLIAMIAPLLFLVLNGKHTRAQSNPPKLEVGAQFAAIRFSDFDASDPGVGGRVTYNVFDHIALEGEVSFFPKQLFKSNIPESRRVEGLFGLKAGMRWKKAGIFGKVRPGFMHFGMNEKRVTTCAEIFAPFIIPGCVLAKGATEFALDVGGVAEVYPARNLVVRFDLGDTIINFDKGIIPRSGGIILNKSATTHNLQFSAGVGIRF
jgi:hypothetical protein